MTIRYVDYCSFTKLPCAWGQIKEIILCLQSFDLVAAPGKSTIEALICQVYKTSDSCLNPLWHYTFSYDSELLENPTIPLATSDIIGVFCKDCFTTWIEESIETPIDVLSDWIPIDEAWTYLSANSVTVPTNATDRFQIGDKIKFDNTSLKFFYVIGVSATVLTLYAGSDYTVANVAISAIFISRADNPFRFPYKFTYTPTWTGFSVNPAGIYEFVLNGGDCELTWNDTANGTSNSISYQFSLPIVAATLLNMKWYTIPAILVDSGTRKTTPGNGVISSAGSLITLFKDFNGPLGSDWTTSGGKSSAGSVTYRIAGT